MTRNKFNSDISQINTRNSERPVDASLSKKRHAADGDLLPRLP